MTRAQVTSTTQQNNAGAVVPFAVGKNRLINGDFSINQRNFTSVTAGNFTFDRWSLGGSNVTATPETFTPGTAPVSGYEGKTFIRQTISGSSGTGANVILFQKIEDVRTLAGQTATVSFWAKADASGKSISIELVQDFGTGGSPSSRVNGSVASGTVSKIAITTSWARYSATLTVPSISGKTFGTNNNSWLGVNLWTTAGSDYDTRTNSLGIQNNIFDIWGVQLEAGSVATPFQTATGTIQGELAACQRYFINFTGTTATPAMGAASTTTVNRIPFPMPVSMRSTPSASYTGTPQVYDGVTLTNISGIGSVFQDENLVTLDMSVASGLTQYRPYQCYLNNGTINFSSEL